MKTASRIMLTALLIIAAGGLYYLYAQIRYEIWCYKCSKLAEMMMQKPPEKMHIDIEV